MKREVRVSDRVYAALYPRRHPTDPQSFTDHLNTNLVSEVRIETQRFYGGLETIEARYPGLNYTYAPHIKRLSYFPHHRRLFEVFAALGLTNGEVLGLCRWEGTLWARQRYERDEGVKVRDTTGDDIGTWTPRNHKQRQPRKISGPATTGDGLSPETLGGDGPDGDCPSRGPQGLPETHRRASHTSLENETQSTHAAAPAGMSSMMLAEGQHQLIDGRIRAALPTMVGDGDSATPDGSELPADDRSRHNALHAITSDALRRMRALAELRASGRDIDPSDPAFEQYLKEHAEAADILDGYEAAQTIANVMSTVNSMDARSPPAAEVQGMDLR